jgi:dGTPase
LEISRNDRYAEDKKSDNRTPAQRDRDRILYTSAFRRLARVTQVVSAEEGHVFHNRLTHSIQVAQVGRRIAEKLVNERMALGKPLTDVNPDVVEAACLAHDLGHPPFGHVAEKELDRLATAEGVVDGFEGNAQSFRIVTRLASASSAGAGLNLTRATLNGLLKYPWLRNKHPKIKDKWGAYDSEEDIFVWARDLSEKDSLGKSAEAYLMDLADDITYSVHDLDDFYRAGLIPLDRLRIDAKERERFYAEVFERRSGKLPSDLDESYLRRAFDNFVDRIPLEKPYEGTPRDRGLMRDFTGAMIGDFVRAVVVEKIVNGRTWLGMVRERKADIFMLKQLTWHYVIKAPSLATQQHGQIAVVRGLFDIFYAAAKEGNTRNLDVFPVSTRELLTKSDRILGPRDVLRIVIDLIASLTEEQAVGAYHRLSGISLGSALMYRWR